MRFSHKYYTYADWYRKQNKNSNYFKKISERYKLFPNMNLQQLTLLTKAEMYDTRKWEKRFELSTLTPSGRKHYQLGLKILAEARKLDDTVSFDDMFAKLKSKGYPYEYKNLQKNRVREFITSGIDEYGYIKVNDNVTRIMHFFNKDGRTVITIKGNKRAHHISRYWHAVKKYRDTGDYSGLEVYKGQYLLDVNGHKRYFITDKNLLKHFINFGETDFYEIYAE